MGIHQVHEQNSAVIKSLSEATQVLHKDVGSGLARWELYLHELSLMINEYGSTSELEFDLEPLKYQEDSKVFQNQFSVSRLNHQF